MKILFLLLVVGCGLLVGCRNDDKNAAYARDWEAQMKQTQAQLDAVERQAKRTDEQQAKAEEQQKRMDKVLEKWEEQGRRLDAILDKLEKTSGTNK
jgi:septal ring factor EnvC (AmiA/AmiB activator)